MISAMCSVAEGWKEPWWKDIFRDFSNSWNSSDRNRIHGKPDFHHKFIRELLQISSPFRRSSYVNVCGSATKLQCIGNTADVLPPALLWDCGRRKDLATGIRLHDEIRKRGLAEKDYSDSLVAMYAKCGELQTAQALLDMYDSKHVVPWTALIAGYTHRLNAQAALDCFEKMVSSGVSPNSVTYACILKSCALIGAADKGKQIHEQILRRGLLSHNIVLGAAIVDMYAKCGAFHQARSVLETLPLRDVVCWNALITGYAQHGQGQQALECFEQMQHEGVCPSAVTYSCILKACAAVRALDKGKQIHDEILRQGLLENNTVLGTALMDMYAKCGALPQAQSVLQKLSSHDVVSWNSLITGYTQNGQEHEALECIERMQQEAIDPNPVTYGCILKACAAIGALDIGMQIHDKISRWGLLKQDVALGTAVVDMYAKCGALRQAQSVLDDLPSRDVVSWDALISGYAQKGLWQQALECFRKMQHEGIPPNVVTFLFLLNLCGHLGLVEKGQKLFDSMEAFYDVKPDVECFTCMIDLLGRAGHLAKALKVIQTMPFSANSSIWHCVLGACQKSRDVDMGLWAYEQAVELDKYDESAYALMVNVYMAAGMQEKAKGMVPMKIKRVEGLK